METYETYCLVPPGDDLAALLHALFEFDRVIFYDGDDEFSLANAEAAVSLFRERMTDGEGIRLQTAKVPDTSGGWLYREWQGSAVIGLSANAAAPAAAFARLTALVPNGHTRVWGDQPPPETREEFLAPPKP